LQTGVPVALNRERANIGPLAEWPFPVHAIAGEAGFG
jgi:hypothetical protein